MFIYATTKDNGTNPIIVEGSNVYHDVDASEYNKRAELALSISSTSVVIENQKYRGYRQGEYIACQYTTSNKDFANRYIPITVCMKNDESFDMTTIHTLWQEGYELVISETSEIQKCLEYLAGKRKSFSLAKIAVPLIVALVFVLIMKCCA